jgi:hypothetical protein
MGFQDSLLGSVGGRCSNEHPRYVNTTLLLTPSYISMARPASKRFYTCKRLRKLLPRLNLTAVIVRVTQFFVIGGFTIAYAMASPEIYLDIFVWPMNQTTPFEITIYRNSSGEWPDRAERFEDRWLVEPWPIVKLRWNETKPPPGLSEVYVCQTDPRWNCTGEQWAASRIGWWDSWPFDHFTPPWAAGMVHIDRYIFWLFMLGVKSILAHRLLCGPNRWNY